MKRQTFLTIAAAVGALFALYMIAAPAKMMEGMGSEQSDTTNIVLQAMSIMLLSIAVMTFFARKDEGSIALRGIFIGSIVMHITLIPIDWIAYQKGIFTQISGIVPGTVIHIVFAIGFIYYLRLLSNQK
jgi:hypothetical protein